MAGIYVHIPFCRKACHYCNFHFSTNHSLLQDMVGAIIKEIDLRRGYLSEPVSTVYFGGGTPSICSNQQISQLIDKIMGSFTISPFVEMTLEANPDDVTAEKLAYWKKCGINRLSIGVQSFVEADLKWMNRAHNAKQAVEAITLAKQNGFDNISIDLIYGTPTLQDDDWECNVQQAIDLEVPHLSCYALTVEPRTALNKMIQLKKIPEMDAEKQARHFELLMQWLGKAGYEHYETSNFSLPNMRSKHNSSYWQGAGYMGVGPSAHSFDGKSRQWNIANNSLYIKGIIEGNIVFEKEELTPTQTLNEYIMTSLRTIEGLSLKKIASYWGSQKAKALKANTAGLIEKGLANIDEEVVRLTNKGILFADGIAADLFF